MNEEQYLIIFGKGFIRFLKTKYSNMHSGGSVSGRSSILVLLIAVV